MVKRNVQLGIGFALACLCAIGVLIYQTLFSDSLPANSLNFDAEVTHIFISSQQNQIVLTISRNGSEQKVILSEKTAIIDEEGIELSSHNLSHGQMVSLCVDSEVVYEPVQTFVRCYRIQILGKETKVQCFATKNNEEFNEKLIGS